MRIAASLAHLLTGRLPCGITIYCMPAFDMATLHLARGPAFFAEQYRIGYWPWELPYFPAMCNQVYALIDEIWAGSEFTAQAYRAHCARPVHRLPCPVVLPRTQNVSRQDLPLHDEGAFVFVYPFDVNSYLLRKNPLSLVRAFRKAFPPMQRRVALLLRVNGNRSTQGNIGFAVRKELLDVVRAWLPEGVSILLAADRFYGAAQLIGWRQDAGWSHRIRLKGNLTLAHQGGELATGDVAARIPEGVIGAELHGSGIKTNIGALHEMGRKEPWTIAMNVSPNRHATLDYGMRWGIENMFWDFKSRGFGLMQSHIQRPERLERLLLVMSIALCWAVSCGAFAEQQAAGSGVKRGA